MKASEIDWGELSHADLKGILSGAQKETRTRLKELQELLGTSERERSSDDEADTGKRGKGRAKPSPTELAEALNSENARTRQLASEGSYVGPNPLLRGNGADAE